MVRGKPRCAALGLAACPAQSPPNRALFEQVEIDEQTGTITWPCDVDLDPDVIYAAIDLGPDKARIYVLAPSVAA